MDRLEAMQVFMRVAQAGSFSAVSQQLNVDRSWVTRQIAALEKHLGLKLFTRSTRRLSLTPAGSIYLEKARVILNLVDAAESDAIEERAVPRGPIRLGVPLSYGLQVLTPWLLEFSKLYPAIELTIDLSDEKANLIEQGLDLSIRITSLLQPGDVVRKLADCPMVTFASPKYLSQHGTPQRPHDLEQHECLVYSNAPTLAQWIFQEGKKKINVAVHGRIVANNGLLLTEAAAQGLGITRQPYFIAKPYLDLGVVRQILRGYEVAPLGVYAVLPSNQYIPHRISVLMQFLVERLTVE
jgi:DNA-binding transcriptional LysR family regulator